MAHEDLGLIRSKESSRACVKSMSKSYLLRTAALATGLFWVGGGGAGA